MYGIRYSASSPGPSDNPTWGHHLSEVRREIYVTFPQGGAGPAYYSFDIIVARSYGWTIEWDSLRLIDQVIGSFQLKSLPKKPVPAPPSAVNP